MRRFEDVVAAANDRLLLVSDGRFELERSDEKEDVRARNTGLAMRVLDHRTGRPQDPRQLSGGETFYVSLCLALGMADVVTAEAGGIDLGTLFVDEGFGSLDEHTLDQVLAELGAAARRWPGGRCGVARRDAQAVDRRPDRDPPDRRGSEHADGARGLSSRRCGYQPQPREASSTSSRKRSAPSPFGWTSTSTPASLHASASSWS